MITKVNEWFGQIVAANEQVQHLHLDPNLEYLDFKFKDRAIDRSIFIEWKKADMLVPFYPLHLIVTNRLANTSNHKSNLMRDI
jgi:hypothetical protein